MNTTETDIEKMRAFGKAVIELADKQNLNDEEYLMTLRMLEMSFVDGLRYADEEGKAVLEA